jgi:hypothetical protein
LEIQNAGKLAKHTAECLHHIEHFVSRKCGQYRMPDYCKQITIIIQWGRETTKSTKTHKLRKKRSLTSAYTAEQDSRKERKKKRGTNARLRPPLEQRIFIGKMKKILEEVRVDGNFPPIQRRPEEEHFLTATITYCTVCISVYWFPSTT